MPIPKPDPLDEFAPELARMVANTSWLPNPAVVANLGRAVFPTSRSKRKSPRLTHIKVEGNVVGMYDDNATPEWAIFWSHGLIGTRPPGWTIAHVWPTSDDIRSYTHLANLAMVREPFASLTDKNGPLTRFLRWHAWSVYAWKPEREAEPTKPDGYDAIEWRYFDPVTDPVTAVNQRLAALNNQRTNILSPIMQRTGPQ